LLTIEGMANGIVVDAREVVQALQRIEPKEMRKITKTAFRLAGNVLKSQAVKNYKAQFPGSERWRAIYALPFRDGSGAYVKALSFKKMSGRKILSIARSIEKKGGGVAGAKSATYGAYILPILEGGTGPRYSRGRAKAKKYNRGKVRAYKFFHSALESKAADADRKFVETCEKRLAKILK
jgi:hypothetical protein